MQIRKDSQNPPASRNASGAKLASIISAALVAAGTAPMVYGSENVPHRPYAQLADLPGKGVLTAGLVYEESEAYRIWADHTPHQITAVSGGEDYGIDINQGYVALQYGINDRWAADANIGVTTAAYRNQDNTVNKTTGLMDFSFGVRYQIFNETNAACSWTPTLTFRAGAVLPGTYNQDFKFAPGLRSAAIEPEFLMRKHVGWPGFGVYADGLFRWNRTTGNDQYITTIGLFQQIKGWELAAGYRHMQSISGGDIRLDGSNDLGDLDYPRAVREINDAIEAGFSYTTSKRNIRLGFNTRTVFDGSNTDRKFWIGGSVDMPFSLFTGE